HINFVLSCCSGVSVKPCHQSFDGGCSAAHRRLSLRPAAHLEPSTIDAVELLSRKHIPVGEKNAIPDPLSRGVNCSPNIRASVENLRGIFLESDHFAGRQRFDTPRKPRDQVLGYPPFPSLGIKQ